jgi:hypothetical protein
MYIRQTLFFSNLRRGRLCRDLVALKITLRVKAVSSCIMHCLLLVLSTLYLFARQMSHKLTSQVLGQKPPR